jgi:hypothetical protein
MGELGPLRSIVLGWFLFLAAVHVMANYWGHGLRHKHRHLQGDDGPPDYALARQKGAEAVFAPTTRLQGNFRPGKRIVVASSLGAVFGGVAGTWTLWLLVWETAGYTGVLLGAVSTSVIGGFLGFLTISFLSVFFDAWTQATRDLHPAKEPTSGLPFQS